MTIATLVAGDLSSTRLVMSVKRHFDLRCGQLHPSVQRFDLDPENACDHEQRGAELADPLRADIEKLHRQDYGDSDQRFPYGNAKVQQWDEI